jgi:hypothetical protein
VSYNAIFLGDG